MSKNVLTFRCRYEVAIRQNMYVSSIGKKRYAFNTFTGIIYAKKYGMRVIFWAIMTLIRSGINPFNCFRRLMDRL